MVGKTNFVTKKLYVYRLGLIFMRGDNTILQPVYIKIMSGSKRLPNRTLSRIGQFPMRRRMQQLFGYKSHGGQNTRGFTFSQKKKFKNFLLGARFCCNRPKSIWLSEDNEVLVALKTTVDIQNGWHGFKLYYKLRMF